MNAHPACKVFPLLEGAEFEALVEDIEKHGQQQPLVIDKTGLLLDGRNRERACRRLKIEPAIETWEPQNGESPIDLVV